MRGGQAQAGGDTRWRRSQRRCCTGSSAGCTPAMLTGRRHDGDISARHALAHIIVCLAHQLHHHALQEGRASREGGGRGRALSRLSLLASEAGRVLCCAAQAARARQQQDSRQQDRRRLRHSGQTLEQALTSTRKQAKDWPAEPRSCSSRRPVKPWSPYLRATAPPTRPRLDLSTFTISYDLVALPAAREGGGSGDQGLPASPLPSAAWEHRGPKECRRRLARRGRSWAGQATAVLVCVRQGSAPCACTCLRCRCTPALRGQPGSGRPAGARWSAPAARGVARAGGGLVS